MHVLIHDSEISLVCQYDMKYFKYRLDHCFLKRKCSFYIPRLKNSFCGFGYTVPINISNCWGKNENIIFD